MNLMQKTFIYLFESLYSGYSSSIILHQGDYCTSDSRSSSKTSATAPATLHSVAQLAKKHGDKAAGVTPK